MPPPHQRPVFAWGLWLIAAGVATAGLLTAFTRLDEVNAHRNPVAAVMLAGACTSPPLLALAAHRLARSGPPAAGPLLRSAFVAAVVLWFLFVIAAGSYHRARVACVAAVWASGVALATWRLPASAGRPRRLTLFALATAIALAVGELALRGAAAALPSPLFTRSAASAQQRLAAHALPPGQRRFGFPTNDLGFYDAPFAGRTATRRPTVAVIGDSFSASFVPHSYHYTTVAERALGGTDLWNVGWPALGPVEYAVLLAQYVLPLDPDAVVVSLFLGNDLAETRPWDALDRALADWFDRGNVLLCEVPRRLWRISRGQAPVAGTDGRDPEPPWLHDPAREPATFTDSAFLQLECERAAAAGTPGEPALPAMLAHLRALPLLAGPRPFGFVLIPDEFMVEDGLWQKIAAATAPVPQRWLLRDMVVAFCREQGIPCLDLLPVLLAEPPLADGDRHLYLRNDTHWNARGNALAGRALVPWLRDLLGGRAR